MGELPQTPPAFSADDVKTLIRKLRQMPDAFATLFAEQPEEALHFRPDGGWSAVEVVWHLADHDAFERVHRFEEILTSERPLLPDDHTRFHVAEANGQARSAEEIVALFRRERGLVVALLERLTPGDWVRTGIHPHDGERTLLQLADLRNHDREHFEQARAAIASATAKP